MTAPMIAMNLIHPPPAGGPPPATVSAMRAYLAAVRVTDASGTIPSAGAVDALLDLMRQTAADHRASHCLCRFEMGPASLGHLLGRLPAYPSMPRLSLAGIIDETPPAGVIPDDRSAVLQIQWRATQPIPDIGCFRPFSRAGVWNHLILEGAAAAAKTRGAVARQPNIVHSWETMGAGDRESPADDGYRRLPPLPGRPLWQIVGDPVQRFVLVDRFGRDRLLRSRVDDDGDRIRVIGESLSFHYCRPDQLPAGYLDVICDMVAAGGTVAATYVRSNLEKAFLVGYVLENDIIVGNSSLKHPRPVYIDAVRRQSGLDLSGFVERGYTSVRPEYRGLGIGTRLLAGLTERADGRRIFSVIAEDNHATQLIARRNDTRRVATYFSQKAGKPVGIWMPAGMIETHDDASA